MAEKKSVDFNSEERGATPDEIQEEPYGSTAKSIGRALMEDTCPQFNNAKLKVTLVLWILGYIIGIIIFIIQMKPLFLKYIKSEISTSITIETANHLDCPSVTVCNPILLKKSDVITQKQFGNLGFIDVAQIFSLQKNLFPQDTCSFNYEITMLGQTPEFPFSPCGDDDTACYPTILKCDGIIDCPNKADEMDCDETSTGNCARGTIQCPGTDKCIWNHEICDGWKDCESGWDEDPSIQGLKNACGLRMCTENYTLTQLDTPFTITIPHSDELYLDNLKCTWTFVIDIDVPGKFQVNVECLDCYMEDSEGTECIYDYLTVTNPDKSKQMYCPHTQSENGGDVLHVIPLLAKGDIFYVSFKSDSNYESFAKSITVSATTKSIARMKRNVSNPDYMIAQKQRPLLRPKRSTQNSSTEIFNKEQQAVYGWANGDFKMGDWRKALSFAMLDDMTDIKILAMFSKENIEKYGLQLNDFIVECNFDGLNCDPSFFMPVINSFTGMCYSINTIGRQDLSKLKTSRTGSDYGLKLTLFMSKEQSIGILNPSTGGTVSIHSYENFPDPSTSRVSIMPGFITQIGLRRVEITREPAPYSKCISAIPSTFVLPENYSMYSYSHKLCSLACIQAELIRSCQCVDDYYFDTDSPNDFIKICDTWDIDQKFCRANVYDAYAMGFLPCDEHCFEACKESAFNMRISYKPWPQKWFVPYFIKSMFRHLQKYESEDLGRFLTVEVEPLLKNFTQNLDKLETLIQQNFARVEVYYEELNYESIKSSPEYEIFSLVADFGGNIGLWIGWSVLIVVDFIEAAIELIWFRCLKPNTSSASNHGIALTTNC